MVRLHDLAMAYLLRAGEELLKSLLARLQENTLQYHVLPGKGATSSRAGSIALHLAAEAEPCFGAHRVQGKDSFIATVTTKSTEIGNFDAIPVRQVVGDT